MVAGPEVSIEVQAVAGEELQVVAPEGRGATPGEARGLLDGLVGVLIVQVCPDGHPGAVEGGAGQERGEVHVRGEDVVVAVAAVVEDLFLGFGGVVRGVQFGVFAEPRRGVEDRAERELLGVRSEHGGREGGHEDVVEVVQGRVVLEERGKFHGFSVGADLVGEIPPLHRAVGVAAPPGRQSHWEHDV